MSRYCWLLLAAAGLIACRSEREQALRSEAGVLVHAVRTLRDAPNDAKRPHLLALKRLSCSSADLCDSQRVCKNAYERHQQALDTTRTLQHAMRDDAGATSSASRLMSEARQGLERARYLTRLCNDLEGQVTRRYRL